VLLPTSLQDFNFKFAKNIQFGIIEVLLVALKTSFNYVASNLNSLSEFVIAQKIIFYFKFWMETYAFLDAIQTTTNPRLPQNHSIFVEPK